ncbi:hypothetical protein JVT61DRAFT_15082 [Boletus reticuloceps]|uniref:G domain-containing protein n=1 Tax=Boletus reticuloceps TaxID=495285 RepID=A0A8I2YSC6_9AGAM|nr:hypothetical protein JVT61DRAFT_15082 [Boletus reticuloceps]
MGSIARSTYSNQTSSKPYVVVIFGRTGVGVSSLVNLILGYHVSNDHPNAKPHSQHPRFTLHTPVTLSSNPRSDTPLSLYEVSGFGGQSSDAAILETIRKIDQREGIDLFVYCLRKQKAMVMPGVVRHIREHIGGRDVPMIAVVTELERFEAEAGMEDWWNAPLGDGSMNGRWIEEMCFGGGDRFDAHACVTTLPRKEVDLVDKLRKRRDISEERVRQLILEQCRGQKRRASDPTDSYSPCRCLSTLFTLVCPRF